MQLQLYRASSSSSIRKILKANSSSEICNVPRNSWGRKSIPENETLVFMFVPLEKFDQVHSFPVVPPMTCQRGKASRGQCTSTTQNLEILPGQLILQRQRCMHSRRLAVGNSWPLHTSRLVPHRSPPCFCFPQYQASPEAKNAQI